MAKPEDKRKPEGQVPPRTLNAEGADSLLNFFRHSSGPTKIKLVSVLILAIGVVSTNSWIIVGLVRLQFGSHERHRDLASPVLAVPVETPNLEKPTFAYELNQMALGFSDRDRRRAGQCGLPSRRADG